MTHAPRSAITGSVVLFAVATTVHAALNQAIISSPGGFVQACAGPSTVGAVGWAGSDSTQWWTGIKDVHEQSFSGNSSANLAASYSSADIFAFANAKVGMGYASMESYDSFPGPAFFSAGGGNGGWKDTITVLNPDHTGESAIMQFTIRVIGRLDASGIAGSASIATTAYQDGIQLGTSPYADPGNSDPISTDRQYGNWSVATYAHGTSDGKNVDGTVTFAVPFSFGVPFELGVYSRCYAGQRSSGSNTNISTSHATLSSFTWSGITNILIGGSPVSGSVVVSDAGIDWTQPIIFAPCPGDLNHDGFVDDSDFVVFVVAYNILDCADPAMPAGCPADLNGDGFVDDADFVIFVGAYNELLCP